MMKYPARVFWGVMLVIFGALMLFDKAELLDLGYLFSTYWPLILVGLGVWVVLGGSWIRRSAPGESSLSGQKTATSSSSDFIDESTVFGDVSVTVRSNAFNGGDVSAVFGNCTVDLSAARLGNGEHKLEVDTVFGQVRLFLPSSMPVKVDADTVMGSVTVNGEKSEGFLREKEWSAGGYAAAAARLRIEISAVFGEVHVTTIGG